MSTVDLSGARWRRSSYSSGEGGGNDNCVEVAVVESGAALRDSKNTADPALVVPAAAWRSLLIRLA